jgi:hypothetical protein
MIEKLKPATQEFIKIILSKMGLKELTADNIDDAYDYIIENYEVQYVENNNKAGLDFVLTITTDMEQYMDFVE